VTADNIVKHGPLSCFNFFELCSVRLVHLTHPGAAGKRFLRGDCWSRLHEYTNDPRTVPFRDQAGEFQHRGIVGLSINEDDYLFEIGSCRAGAKGGRIRN
jgi:hypothetical protein